MIGIREIKRLTDERLIEVRRIAEGDGVGLIEGNNLYRKMVELALRNEESKTRNT